MKIMPPFLFALVCATGFSQSAPKPAAFEVASVHAIEPGQRREKSIEDEPGRLTMRSVTLLDCIEWAYELEPMQVTGPSWMDELHFDIIAKAAEPVDRSGLRPMLATLLAERFGLKFHREQKMLAIYAMTLVPTGARFHEPGPKDASKFLKSTSEGPLQFGGDKTGMTAQRVTMPEIAAQLSQPLQRPVVDRTGLTGKYDIRLDVAAFMTTAGNENSAGPIDQMSVIFSAFPAQLGLKFEPAKDNVDFLIIDSANQVPAEN